MVQHPVIQQNQRLCLELLLQLPPPWPRQQLARVASVAVSASPQEALRLLQQQVEQGSQMSQGRWLVEPLTSPGGVRGGSSGAQVEVSWVASEFGKHGQIQRWKQGAQVRSAGTQ